MKKIIHHLKEEWYKYLLEIIVLIIGIYGAFAVENWNENQQKTSMEKVYLQNLLDDLELQLKEITVQESYEATQKNAITAIVPAIEADFSNVDLAVFNQNLSKLVLGRNMKFYNATFKDLMSTGNINLIRRNSLRSELMSYYQRNERLELAMKANVGDYNRFMVGDLLRKGIVSVQFDYSDFNLKMDSNFGNDFSRDYSQKIDQLAMKKIRSDDNLVFLHNAVNSRNILLNISGNQLNSLRESTEEMITAIESYLKK